MRIHAEEENLPDKKLVSRQKIGPDGTVVTVHEEEAIDLTRQRIMGVTPPPREIEEAVKPTPTKSTLKDHRLVDPSAWGRFAGTGPQKIYGDRPEPRDLPAVMGPSIPTSAETVSETGLLTRAINRLIGDKEK